MSHPFSLRSFSLASLVVVAATVFGRIQSDEPQTLPGEPRWWRGNLHTHSFWSDGDDFPEMIVAWYKEHGYQFLALSDHNVLSEGERWVDAEKHAKGAIVEALPKYRERFGPWVEEKSADEQPMVRLKPLDEFRAHFEQPGRFLLIQSEEITDKFQSKPVHLNATNLRDVVPPQGGDSVVEVMQNNVNAVLEQRRRTGRPMIVHLNHPNFGWGVTAEELAQVQGERFFEVYNGHPGTRFYGDDEHASTDRIWDLVLAARLSQPDGEVMFGLATDDAHNYHQIAVGKSNAGRGWIMVRARHLTAESIVTAMERGEFYASTGVRLRDVMADGERLGLEIDAEPGVSYETEFIGTLRPDGGADKAPDAARQASIKPNEEDIGRVLARSSDAKPSYTFTGRELYVRARVRSSKPHPNPFAEGDVESAWTQPALPSRADR